MHIAHREFGQEILDRITKTVRARADLTRYALGKQVRALVFGEAEWRALMAHGTKNPIAPEQPPALQAAVHMLGGVGGFLGRKCDGLPGAKTLWRGLMLLSSMADVWRVMASP